MKGIKIGVLFFLAIGVGTAFYTNQQGQINQYLESAKTATKAVNFIDKVTNIEQTMNQSTASRKVASEANSKASQAVVEAANKAAKRGANLERCVAGRTRGHKLYGYGLGLVPGATGGVSAAMACDKLIARDKAKKEAKEIAEIKAAIESGFLTHPEVKALNELRVIEFEAALMGPLWFKSKEKRIHELERQLGPHIFKDHDGTKKLEKYEMGDRTRYEKIYNLIKREYEINNLILAQFSKEKKKELCEEWIKVAQVSVNNKSRLHKFAGYYAKRKGDFSEK
ncbi:MAG: hypothetical protein HN730_12990, partial [Bdellovibrionales bacterium]|nr:hypothetical protein [Bdellovibrionales bacterium]